MDLKNLEVLETCKIEIVHPETGEVLNEKNKPFFVEVYGQDSDHYKTLQRRELAKLRTKSIKNKRKTGSQIDLLEAVDSADDMLVESVKDWFLIEDGKEIEFSKKEIKSVFKKYPWIKEQIQEAMADRVNFMKK